MSTEDIVTMSFDFPSVGAGTDEALYAAFPHEGTWELVKAYFTPWTNRTANDTNYTTVSVELLGASVASFTTETSGSGGNGNLVAGTPVEFSLSNAAEIGQGDTVAVLKADTASGVALDGCFTFRFERIV